MLFGVFLEVQDTSVAADVGVVIHVVGALGDGSEAPSFLEFGSFLGRDAAEDGIDLTADSDGIAPAADTAF